MTTSDTSAYARRCAAYALGLLGKPEARGVLEKALKDKEAFVRNNAEAALTMLKMAAEQEELPVIPGTVPPPTAFPPGCAFHPRCPFVEDRCRSEIPDLTEASPGHHVRCHRYQEIPQLRAEGVSF